ncbi:hypothetical protein SAMN06297164_3646 [Nitrosomonas ureae]|uniref:Uncharacterized protein n=1 Tax=Nitrosomonas ureae TaxID=44577 RepID=A0A286AMB1_9PROT|nr:hypothetical protein SAMN06297164_3646 [Nitrosomonas ureae]
MFFHLKTYFLPKYKTSHLLGREQKKLKVLSNVKLLLILKVFIRAFFNTPIAV